MDALVREPALDQSRKGIFRVGASPLAGLPPAGDSSSPTTWIAEKNLLKLSHLSNFIAGGRQILDICLTFA